MSKIDISQKVDVNKSSVTGRNGYYPIKEVRVWEGTGRVYIDAVGRRGRILNAGLIIDQRSFDELVSKLYEQIHERR